MKEAKETEIPGLAPPWHRPSKAPYTLALAPWATVPPNVPQTQSAAIDISLCPDSRDHEPGSVPQSLGSSRELSTEEPKQGQNEVGRSMSGGASDAWNSSITDQDKQ